MVAIRSRTTPTSAGADRPGVRLVWLAVTAATLADRLPARPGHFFPARLLESQLAIEELPEADERVLVVAGDRPTTEVVQAVIAGLADHGGGLPFGTMSQ